MHMSKSTQTSQAQTIKTLSAIQSEVESINRIALSVDCVIFGYDEKELKVLLIKSDLKEFAGLYSLLGDLIGTDEDLESASYRILKERTGMDDVYLEQVYTFGSLGRHPSGRVITTAYYSLVDIWHQKMKLSHNELYWHSVKELKKLAEVGVVTDKLEVRWLTEQTVKPTPALNSEVGTISSTFVLDLQES